ncbi:MAG: Hsp20/alpha crystallin family protein [Thermoplasmatota archaeon]
MGEDKEIKEREDEEKGLAERQSEWFYRPLEEMDRMFEDIDKTFKRFFGQPLMRRGRDRFMPSFETGFRSPALDIRDLGDQYSIQAEIPGLDKDDIELEITEDKLTIKAEKEQEKKEEGEDYVRRERGYRSFYRELPLSDEVISEETKASYKKGVLDIRIPKKEKEKKEGIKVDIE